MANLIRKSKLEQKRKKLGPLQTTTNNKQQPATDNQEQQQQQQQQEAEEEKQQQQQQQQQHVDWVMCVFAKPPKPMDINM